jgi:lysophospholipid acyltransferase (LPLAT)-like uncharacterized protein
MTGWLLRWMVTAIGSSIRWRIEDAAGLLREPPARPVIFAFWHNRIFLMPYLFRKHWSRRQRERVAVLVSASRDGERLARVLRGFDLLCVRGSSSRRGRQALRELTQLVQAGYDAGITPDGPRGPRYRVQQGIISLAQWTQAPIVPVSYTVSRAVRFSRSWDEFMVPVPFARGVLRIGAALWVARDADEATREQKRLELERVLQQLSV